MAFFEQLSKTVSEASQKTIAKTKEFADTTRLSSMISDEEKNIANQYLQIGKLYVCIHKDNYEEDFAGMINMIFESEAKIEDYRRQIQEIKGIQRCEKCGAEVPRGASFCSSCGETMPQNQIQELGDYVKCASCGAEVKKGMRFCTSCGRPMEMIIATTEEAKSDVADGRVCSNCGVKVECEMDFCTECGTKL